MANLRREFAFVGARARPPLAVLGRDTHIVSDCVAVGVSLLELRAGLPGLI